MTMGIVSFVFQKEPSIAEMDFSGVVISVGRQVPVIPTPTNKHRYFPIGTAVFGLIPVGEHLNGVGALAEYLIVEMSPIPRKPTNISFDRGAGLPVSGATTLTHMVAAKLHPGDRVFLNSEIGHIVDQSAPEAVSKDGYLVGRCSPSSFETAKTVGCNDVVSYGLVLRRSALPVAIVEKKHLTGGLALMDARSCGIHRLVF
ncbi:hypothetical protein BDV29DRAFT_155053 [Aspergillus leporis]|jgi:NADPH:quinone reductase-like Zn-dependent oxidoreductase|uniref:Chaperonin 10-like protein n=1 Tax=Aspergillus leporis TaxID=41062 RepID=A0A5N5X7S5_9EURO|nr:hypothetical protein BDV29DRAFT_155053 [Aspergillus leporis]